MKVEDNNFANARFLNLTEAVGASSKQKVTKVTSELAAETSLRKMVTNLHYAFEKQNIDMTSFKPNQFAALSVYYDQCLTQVTNTVRSQPPHNEPQVNERAARPQLPRQYR